MIYLLIRLPLPIYADVINLLLIDSKVYNNETNSLEGLENSIDIENRMHKNISHC